MKNTTATRIFVALFVLQSLFFGLLIPSDASAQTRVKPKAQRPAAKAPSKPAPPRKAGVAPSPAEADGKLEFEGNSHERGEWFRRQRAHPFNEIPRKAREQAFQQAEAMRSLSPVTADTWTSIGPGPTIANAGGLGVVSGRINAIAVSPTNPQLILVGGVTGGIWRSLNGGLSWAPVSDSQVDLAIGSIAFTPDGNTVYAGLGNWPPIDGYLGSGVLKSTDAGANWTLAGSAGLPEDGITSRIAISAGGGNRVYLALGESRNSGDPDRREGGIFYSLDGGSSWLPSQFIIGTPPAPTNSAAVTDLAVHPTDPLVAYAAVTSVNADSSFAGLYKTTDGGLTFSSIYTSPYTTTDGAKVAVTPFAPNNVFFYLGDKTDQDNANSRLVTHANQGIGPTPWTNLGQPQVSAGVPIDTGQFDYNMYLAVAPNSDNTIYIGNRDLFRSTDGGVSWTNLTTAWRWETSPQPKYVYDPSTAKTHSDQQTLTFGNTAGSVLYIGNDGGITRVTNNGASFSSLNSGLGLTQFVGYAINPSNSSLSYGGTQDNGNQKRINNSNTWEEFRGGDGGACVINPANHGELFTTYTEGHIDKFYVDGLIGPLKISPSWGPKQNWNERIAFYPPFVSNSVDDTLYIGTYRLFKSTNVLGLIYDWTAPGGNTDLTEGGSDTLSAIGVERTAYSNAQTIYTGSEKGRLNVSRDGGQTWTDRTAGLPDRSITSISVMPGNPELAYVTLSGFLSGHVFVTSDAGANWTNISSGIPDIPVNTLLIHRTQANMLFVGTDVGVFRSVDGGSNWVPYNQGMPPTIVTSLVTANDGTIQAASYGRGAFHLEGSGSPPPTGGGGGGGGGGGYVWTNRSQFNDDDTITRRDNEWDNPKNWNPEGVPGGTTIVVNANPRSYIDRNGNVHTYVPNPVNLKGETVTLAGVNISGNVVTNGKLSLTNYSSVSGGSLQGEIFLAGTLSWTGGTIGDTPPAYQSPITINPGAHLSVSGPNQKVLYGSITNSGTVTYTGGAPILIGLGDRNVTNNGTIVATSDGTMFGAYVGDIHPKIINNSIFKKTGGNAVTTITNDSRVTFVNEPGATINIERGVLRVAQASTIKDNTNITGDGKFLFDGGSSDWQGNVNVTGNLEIANGEIRPTFWSRLNSSDNKSRWTGGYIHPDLALFTIPSGSTLNIEGPNPKYADSYGTTFDNQGTINWSNDNGTGGQIILNGEGLFVNGGTFNADSGGAIFGHGPGSPRPTFVNNGTFNKRAAAATTEFTADDRNRFLNNATGIINVESGELLLTQEKKFMGGSSITGAGKVLVSNGYTALNGNTMVTGNLELAGGEVRPESAASLTGLGNKIRWTGSYLNTGSFGLTIPVGSVFNIEGSNDKTISSYGTFLDNQGTINWSNAGSGGRIILSGSGTFNNNGAFNVGGEGTVFSVQCCGSIYPLVVNNVNGTFTKTAGVGVSTISDHGNLTTHNFGTIGANIGTLRTITDLVLKNGGRIGGTNGQFLLAGGITTVQGTTTIDGNTDNFVLGTGGNLHGANPGGGTLLGENSGRLVWSGGWIRGGIAFGASGRMKIRSADEKGFDGAGINSSGTVDWEDGNVIFANNSTFNNLGGATFNAPTSGGFVFGGFGVYQSWFVNGGVVNIGSTTGKFAFNDGRLNFINQATGTLNVDVGGPIAGTGFDQIDGSATVSIEGGSLVVNILNSYLPNSGTLFPIIKHSGRTGSFTNVQVFNHGLPRGFSVRYNPADISLRAFEPNAPPAPNTPLPENWFRADALAGANNSPVATWIDASGKLNEATQATANRQPKLINNAMNGKPVVRFDGVDDQMQFERTVDSDLTITAVFQSKRGLGTSTNWWEGAGLVDMEVGGYNQGDFGLSLNVDGRLIAGTGSSAPDTSISSNGLFNDGRPHIVTFTRQRTNGARKLYVDGTLAEQDTAGVNKILNSAGRITLGSIQTDINYLNGDIAEVLVYNSVLSDTDRGSIYAYLTNKYAPTGPQTVWDAAADFLPNRNPAFGWTYGYSQGGVFSPFTDRAANEANAGIDRWNNASLGTDPSIRGNLTGTLVDYYGTARQTADELSLHPNHAGAYSVLRWTAPEAGSYLVQGRFDGNDYSRGTTSDVKLNHNANTLLASPLNGFGTTIPFNRIVTAAQGDTLDFAVGKGTNNADYDITGLAATITKSTMSISGNVTKTVGGGPLAGITVHLKQNNLVVASETTDAGGSYAFASSLTAGANYVVEPLVEDYSFAPATTAINALSGNQAADFAATQIAFFAEQDFSITNNPSGAWRYGWTGSRGSAFNQFTTTTNNGVHELWYNPAIEAVSVAHRVSNPAGMLQLHPGVGGQYPVLRWVAPTSGTFRVLGSFVGNDCNGPQTSTDVAILQNSQTLTVGNVIGCGNTVPYDLTVTVYAGDTVDFTLGFGVNGWYGYDSTSLSATIRPVTAASTANSISGTATGNDGVTPIPNAVISLYKDGRLSASALTNAAGQYSFPNLVTNGDYVVSAAKTGSIFSPASRSFLHLSGAKTADFTTGTPATQATQCVVPSANIVSWYRGEDNPSDHTGGNNGTLESGVSYVDGKVGRAFDFTGSGGVALGDPANLKITNTITLSAWIKPRPMADNTYGTVIGKWNNVTAGDSYLMFLYKRPGGGIELADAIGRPQDGDPGLYTNILSQGAAITPDTWTHVAIVYNAADGVNIGYVNGIEVGRRTRTGGITNSNTPIYIGRRNAGGSTIPFNGAIDEPSVFNRVLTAGEIRSVMDADSSGQCSSNYANTPQGTSVDSGTMFGSVTFPNVTTAGTTTFTVIDPTQGQPTPPSGYSFNPSFPAYDISSTAVYSGSLIQCLTVPGVSDPFAFVRLRILHIENGIWVDRTYSRDVATRTICSQTTSLSPFAVADNIGPTASNVTITGRVLLSTGRAIQGAIVRITDSSGGVRQTRTSATGAYSFDNVAAGETYVISVVSKQFRFAAPSRVVLAADDVADIDFTSIE